MINFLWFTVGLTLFITSAEDVQFSRFDSSSTDNSARSNYLNITKLELGNNPSDGNHYVFDDFFKIAVRARYQHSAYQLEINTLEQLNKDGKKISLSARPQHIAVCFDKSKLYYVKDPKIVVIDDNFNLSIYAIVRRFLKGPQWEKRGRTAYVDGNVTHFVTSLYGEKIAVGQGNKVKIYDESSMGDFIFEKEYDSDIESLEFTSDDSKTLLVGINSSTNQLVYDPRSARYKPLDRS